jgi:hypothetical protein
MQMEMFVDCVSEEGEWVGVFEYDGETGYFYIYNLAFDVGSRVVESMLILTGAPDFAEAEVAVRWARDGTSVGLFIRDVLWGLFNVSTRGHESARYQTGAKPPTFKGAKAFDLP